MFVTDEIAEVRKVRWADPASSWGLVPTMGYLHEGHLALVRAAKAANDYTAVTIYVNPTQFAPTEDLATYPRDLERDLALLRAEGVDLVFTPSDATMYPPGFQTAVSVTQLAQLLEGASRPDHFAGVALVVAKLFNIIQPTRAYFGQKDYQQTVVLRQMVRDLDFNLTLIVCPTVREADGLALSSRNKYLQGEARTAALVLSQSLTAVAQAVQAGERNAERLRAIVRNKIAAEPLARLDYVSVADAKTLAELDEVPPAPQGAYEFVVSLAVFIGSTRLIDNLLLRV